MTFGNLIEWLEIGERVSPLLIFGLLLVAGALGGQLAKLCRLPTITGNIFGGVIIGPYCLGIVREKETIEAFQSFSSFAMSLIIVYVGAHLSYRRIHNALKRISMIGVGEALGAGLLVGTVSYLILSATTSLPQQHCITQALLMSVLAMDSAPATIIHIVRENKAKGTFVKTLLSVVAVDNIMAIFCFAIMVTFVHQYYPATPDGAQSSIPMLKIAYEMLGAIVLGCFIGWVTSWVIRKPHFHNFTAVFLAVLFSEGISSYCGVSPLLTSLTIGVYFGNSSHEVEEQLRALEPIEWLIFVCFFTLAGVTLHLSDLPKIGVLGAAFIAMRVTGKAVGAMLGGLASGTSRRIWLNIPLALTPQAGLAIALVLILQSDEQIPAVLRTEISTLVLAAVVVNEIFGPVLARLAIKRAKEAGKDRPRLIEFLDEEFIMTDLKAKDKTEAIRELTDFMVRTHRIEHINPDKLYRSVLKREEQEPTAIGLGCAIPHGEIPEGPAIQGVMGICHDGIDWGAPDGQPAQIIVMIITPREHRAAHLKVLAAVGAMARNEVIRTKLVTANNANEAWEILEGEETPNYNYFLED